VVFALLVLVKLCSLVSLSLLLDLLLLVMVDWWFSVVVMARSVVLVGFCVVPVRNPLVWWSYVRGVSTKSLRVGMLLHLSSPLSLVFVCGYKHKRQRRRQVEQHTHTQGLRTDTTHIRPPDQRIP